MRIWCRSSPWSSIGYTVTNQPGDVAPGTFSIQVDGRPALKADTLVARHGKAVTATSLVAGLVTPGLAGDVLSLLGIGTTGTLGAVSFANGRITYAATGAALTAAVARGSANDGFAYTVRDQLVDTAIGTVILLVR